MPVAMPRRPGARRWVVIAGAVALVLGMAACAPPHAEEPSQQELLAAQAALGAGSSGALSISPDRGRLLVGTFGAADFGLLVVERTSGRVLARDQRRSKHVAPSWRADGGTVAFFADSAGDQQYALHFLDPGSGRVRRAAAPPTRVPPKSRWAPRGAHLAYVAHQPGQRDLVAIDATRQPDQPWTLATGLAPEADISWSPDGGAIATVVARDPGAILVVRVDDGARTRIPVSPGLELRDLAWAPDGRSMLVTGRAPADEFFGLFEVSLPAGTARAVASFGGDVSDPLYHPGGRSIAFHVSVDGDLRLVVCERRGAECRTLGWSDGRTGLVDFFSQGDSAVVVHTGRTSPPGLYAVPVGGGDPVPVYRRRARPVPGPAVAGARIDVRSPDGLRVPAYLWRSPERSGPPAALIRIHGGPAAQATPAWDPGIQYLVRAGFDVIQLNYRGSTGYGARFERAAGGDSARVLDVLAARDYAVRTLGVDPARVVLYGHSFGAVLAARAAAAGPEACGPVMLVAITRDAPSPGRPGRGCSMALVFHGERDPLPPAAAQALVRTSLGGASGSPVGRFRVFAEEGHSFQRIESWAEVYASATRLLPGAGKRGFSLAGLLRR